MSYTQFAVTVRAMDYTKWAHDTGLEPELASADFSQFCADHLSNWLEMTLANDGYNVIVDVTEMQMAGGE